MNLKSALVEVKQKSILSRSEKKTFDFFIKGDKRISQSEELNSVQKVVKALEDLYKEAYKQVDDFIKNTVIPQVEMVKLMFENLPALLQILVAALPFMLQPEGE